MREDISLNEDGSLVIRNGDFVIGPSDTQHIKDIVLTHPGEFKEFPMLGFGAELQLKKNPNDLAFKRDLKIQLEYDGYPDPDIDLSGGYENLKINI
ncbi:oxidase [Elizabethkingia anophelis]|nr:oxidase [Elizabethkingia anophelis]